MSTHPRSLQGFTLVEALVALLVLSIGLLGIAALQMTGLRANVGAGWRSQATYLSYDIIDRMRANRTVAVTGTGYNIGLGAAPSGSSTLAQDLQAWKASLAATLPSGDGTVVYAPATNIVTVTVSWNDRNGSRDLAGQQPVSNVTFTTRSRL